jgi:DNA adenine methylase
MDKEIISTSFPGGNSIKAPFPYFGGKSAIASLVWERLGNVANYV